MPQEVLDNEISIVPFKHKHYDMLIDMLTTNNYPHLDYVTLHSLPKIGYIALINGAPVAAGFLRRVEGGLAQLDGLTSNAYLGSIIRHHGIDGIVKALIDDAKRLKLQGIIAHVKDESILKRADSLGFKEIPQKLIALALG